MQAKTSLVMKISAWNSSAPKSNITFMLMAQMGNNWVMWFLLKRYIIMWWQFSFSIDKILKIDISFIFNHTSYNNFVSHSLTSRVSKKLFKVINYCLNCSILINYQYIYGVFDKQDHTTYSLLFMQPVLCTFYIICDLLQLTQYLFYKVYTYGL